jgi:hypothetical protein
VSRVFLEIFKKTIKDEKDRKKTTVFNGLLRPAEKDQKDSNPGGNEHAYTDTPCIMCFLNIVGGSAHLHPTQPRTNDRTCNVHAAAAGVPTGSSSGSKNGVTNEMGWTTRIPGPPALRVHYLQPIRR